MAIERIQQPNRWSAVYSPIIYKFRSTFDSGYKITTPVAPSVIGDSNGFLLVTFAADHGLAAGDYAYIESDFSGVYRVIDCPGSAQAIFDADGTVGQNMVQAYKYAYKYMASVEVFAKINNSYTSIGTVTTKPVDDGTDIIFTFDVSGVLRSYISSNIPNLYGSGVQIAADAFKEYYIQYREEYIHGVNGVPQYEEFDWITDTDSSYYDTNEKVAVNATEQYTQQIGDPYKQSEYVLGLDSGEIKFLSNQPDGVEYSACRKYFAYFNNEIIDSDGFFQLRVNQYNGNALLETNEVEHVEIPLGQHYFEVSNNLFTLNPSATKICVDATLPEYSFTDQLKNNNKNWSLQDNGVNVQFSTSGALFNQNTIPLPTFSVNGYMDKAILTNGFTYRIRVRVINTAAAPSGVVIIDAGGNGTSAYTITTAGDYDFNLTADGSVLRIQATYYDDNDIANEFIVTNFKLQTENEEHAQPICYNVVDDCDCSDNYYNVVWLNNKGGYSNFYFTGRATHGIDVDRQTPIKYNLLPNNFAPANRQYGNLRNVTRQRITLRNETTNKQVHEWLASEISQSIDVFMVRAIDGVDYLLPIVVDVDSVTLFKDKDKRYVFTCEALYGFELKNQTR